MSRRRGGKGCVCECMGRCEVHMCECVCMGGGEKKGRLPGEGM